MTPPCPPAYPASRHTAAIATGMRIPLRLRLPHIALGALIMIATTAAMAERPVVIAHRGASGYLPEHTLESKAYAHALGVDYLEQDVVLSRDGVPVVLHDLWLDDVTDVRQVFPGRQREDGRFYVIDFSLAELRQLAVHERRNAQGDQRWPARFAASGLPLRIPTLAEELAFIQALNRSTGREVGVYTEIKSPAWHRAAGMDASRAVLAVLSAAGYSRRGDNAYLQCFDPAELRRIRVELGSDLKLVQLIGDDAWGEAETDYAAMRSAVGLAAVAGYADAIGAWLRHLLEPSTDGTRVVSTGLAQAAHEAGLDVHGYTFRRDELPPEIPDAQAMHGLLFGVAAIDGLFSDHPDVTLEYLAADPTM